MPILNSINNASSQLTIDQQVAVDSYIQYAINSTAKYRFGIDQSDSNALKISLGNALGTNDAFVMTTAGEQTLPLQPAFLAYRDADDLNVTGDGTVYTITYDNEVFDKNSDFNGTTTFTAPVAGIYYLYMQVTVTPVTSSYNFVLPRITASTAGTYRPAYTYNPSGNTQTVGVEVIAQLAASETVTTQIQVTSSTKVIDILGNTGLGYEGTYFMGYLL